MKAEMVMKKENNKWYIGWIIFPAWYLIGKKYIILPVIQSVFEAMSYSAKNEILNSTTTFGGGIYSRTVKVYSFI